MTDLGAVLRGDEPPELEDAILDMRLRRDGRAAVAVESGKEGTLGVDADLREVVSWMGKGQIPYRV